MARKLELKSPTSVELRNLIMELQEPVVFHGFIETWDVMSWTLESWAEKLGDRLLPFRIGVNAMKEDSQWEGDCKTIHCTMNDFIRQATEPTQWLYFDYKHMNEWFKENQDILESISWNSLGFPERKGNDSTLWIGSSGAHTPCHQDSYGCNLVAQIYGSKQWILFPPEVAASMLPTRVPYEESSIYSRRNFFCPTLNMLTDDLRGSRVITLQPGDVLFVPKRWWHYVENINTAISINTWIPLPSDDISRLDESLVRFFISQVSKDIANPDVFLNPNEKDLVDLPLVISISQIKAAADITSQQNYAFELSSAKKRKYDTNDECCSTSKSSIREICQYKGCALVPVTSDSDLRDILANKRNSFQSVEPSLHCQDHIGDQSIKNTVPKEPLSDNFEYTLKNVVNSFCHPDVVTLIRNNLINQCMK